ncbi:hypothetical protein [Acidaminococcus fermentans]|uniref:hypothetical protein n=1 Tax=Acidaminococcus fermentans TaxID=905 RepID=UPI00265FB181|nr:hypothetical protein [Acidaminococcus fermentans]
MTEKTIAIATERVNGSGDEFTHVMGVGISLQSAVDEYRRYWEHQEKSDKARTSYSYVAVVPVPADPPEDGDELYWYDQKIVLPCLWENTIIDSVDVVKDGKWIA